MTVATSTQAPILAIDSLSVAFAGAHGPMTAVNGVTLQIASGGSLGLVGESGSGKSTLGSACLRLLPKSARLSGSVRVCGVEVVGAREQDLQPLRGRRAAMIFQNPMVSLSPFRTVGTQMIDMIRACKPFTRDAAWAAATTALGQVQLPTPEAQLTKFPHQLSGGQLQRVMIAVAVACGPALLIADEPTTALDVTIQAEILALLKDLRAKNDLALLFISHNLGVVADLCAEVAVMQAGRVVEHGAADKVLQTPEHPYTKQLIESIPRLGQTQPAPRTFPAAAPLLRVEGLNVRFRSPTGVFHAVKNVSFGVARGGALGLIGESGSGKSTIATSLIGLTRTHDGSAHLDNLPLLNQPGAAQRQIARRIGIVFQNPYGSLNPRLRVADAVGEPLRVHRKIRGEALAARIRDLLADVGLDAGFLDRFPAALSGGQRQRVAIARALALEPDLLILDEPTAALDVTVQAQVVDMLRRLRSERGLAYLFISHDLAVVESLADDVVVLRRGEIIEAGPVDTVFRHPKADYTKRLVEAATKMDGVTPR